MVGMVGLNGLPIRCPRRDMMRKYSKARLRIPENASFGTSNAQAVIRGPAVEAAMRKILPTDIIDTGGITTTTMSDLARRIQSR